MSTINPNEPEEQPISVDGEGGPGPVDYRTSVEDGTDKNELTTASPVAPETIYQAPPHEQNQSGNSAQKYQVFSAQPRLLPGIVLSIFFTAVSVLLAGLTIAPVIGVLTSAILTAYWGFVNYRLCKSRTSVEITPMRALAMSVFANQFGGAHAVLFANALFQIIFPVLRTLRPPDIVVSFANLMGFAMLYILLTLVACLTVWWQIELANKVYGAGVVKNTPAGLAIGLIFAMSGVWVVASFGSPAFADFAPLAVNGCYIPVFVIARMIMRKDIPLMDKPGVAVAQPRRTTAEWLLLTVYALTVFFSGSSPGFYSVCATVFSGIPVLIWLAYLLSERKKRAFSS